MTDHRVVTPAQRLAAVVGKCFATQSPATRDALRHAVYSKVVGREIKSGADLTENEIKLMLQEFEHHESPFLPSDRARNICPQIAADYQREHGQGKVEL